MGYTAIFYFFAVSWALGFSLTAFLKKNSFSLERESMRVGIGLCAYVVLGIIFNLVGIPLDWKWFLLVSLFVPAFLLVTLLRKGKEGREILLTYIPKKIPSLPTKWTVHQLSNGGIILIVLFSLFMYTSGAFGYPYLENDDPWVHALSVKYTAVEKNVAVPDVFNFKYLDPYPPGFAILMGTLHQLDESISWTLKYFNALIIALSLLFFYFFAKRFIGGSGQALLASFILACIPSYFTHFIWAHTFVIMLFFPTMYAFEMIREDSRWKYLAIIGIGAILMTQPSQAIKLGIMIFFYVAVKCIMERKFLKPELVGMFGGVLLSLLWWGTKVSTILAEKMVKAESVAVSKGIVDKPTSLIGKTLYFAQNYLSPDSGTATRAYTLSDFMFAKTSGMINVQVGWGLVVTLLFIFGVILALMEYKKLRDKKHTWIVITLVWFIFTYLGTNTVTFNLPIGLIAFRFWILMAIPVALMGSYGVFRLIPIIQKKHALAIPVLMLVIFGGVIATSGYQKYHHNAVAVYPPGAGWGSSQEMQGFIWLKTSLEPGTKVFQYGPYSDTQIIGMDMGSCFWCEDVVQFREELAGLSLQEVHSFLKKNEYEYMIISGRSAAQFTEKYDLNTTNRLFTGVFQGLQQNQYFTVVHQSLLDNGGLGSVVLRVL